MLASTASAASTSVMLLAGIELRLGQPTAAASPAGDQIAQAGIAQRPPADRRAVDAVAAA